MRTFKIKISKEDLKRKLNIKDGKTPTKAELKEIIEPLIPKVKDGDTPTDTRLRRLIKPLIPDPIPGSPDKGEEIIEKINEDKSKKKIRKEKVEGWDDLESEVRTVRASTTTFMGSNFIYLKDLSAQTDGVTKTFTVPARQRSIMLVSSDAPFFLFPTNGFTETAATITLSVTTAPSAGSQLALLYVLV